MAQGLARTPSMSEPCFPSFNLSLAGGWLVSQLKAGGLARWEEGREAGSPAQSEDRQGRWPQELQGCKE